MNDMYSFTWIKKKISTVDFSATYALNILFLFSTLQSASFAL